MMRFQGLQDVSGLLPAEEERKAVLDNRVRSFFRKIGLSVGEEAIDKLYIYASELLRWNRAYNLVSRKLNWDDLVFLMLDSLTPLSVKGLIKEGLKVLDVGSGAGMPGIPLFICSKGIELVLLEPVRKKVTFMRHIIRTLSLSGASVIAARMESLLKDKEKFGDGFDLLISRAAMPPIQLLMQSPPCLSDGGKVLVFASAGDVKDIKRESVRLAKRGLEVCDMRSTARFLGKDNYLVIAKKL